MPKDDKKPDYYVETKPEGGWEPYTDDDLLILHKELDVYEGWTLIKDKKGIKSWFSEQKGTDSIKAKVSTTFSGFSAATLYDVLADPEYRSQWDDTVLSNDVTEHINKANEICYYAAKFPAPLTDRDWVLKTMYDIRTMENGLQQYIIMDRSVLDESIPPKKKFVRAHSFLIGYRVRELPKGEDGAERCSLDYISSNDFQGKIPKSIVNFTIKKACPACIDKVAKASKEYPAWKAQHNPENKPWTNLK